MGDERYKFQGTSLKNIRNKNELRVIGMMQEVLDEFPDYTPSSFDLEDIYALSLNKLPARYVQVGTIVLRGEVTDDNIRKQIRAAVKVVSGNPKIKDA